jgi:peptidoglycan hydrolase-like protein with peptidoglycan-binding domain
MPQLLWLPQVLKSAGLKVAPQPGWEARGHGPMGNVIGVMCHQTEDPGSGNMPSLGTLIRGRAGVPGPLSQLGLGRDGTYYIIAAGRCSHAGVGEWQGVTSGNLHYIGIEAENRGRNDPWPSVQMEAYQRGVAAILKHIGRGAEACLAHKEWARNRTTNKRFDPGFDMAPFRAAVSAILNGSAPPLRPIPPVEPVRPDGRPGRPTLRRGMSGEFVRQVQERLGVFPSNGQFGPRTEAAVRAFQREQGLVPDGIIGPRSWQALDADDADDGSVGGAAAPGPQLAWGAKVSPAFRQKVRVIAAEIGCEADSLMACMAFESGETFSPAVKNQAGSGATGLIQFMPTTARALGTTTTQLAAMSAEDQLDYVARYFRWFRGVRTLEDVYMAILWPRAIGEANDFVLFQAPTKTYRQNRGLDKNGDGKVTKLEAAAAVRAKLEKGRQAANLG